MFKALIHPENMNRLPNKVEESLFLKKLKTQLDKVLSNLL